MDLTNAHPSRLLSEVAVAYVNPTRIGTRIAPLVPTTEEHFAYPVFGHEAFRVVDDAATRYGGGAVVDISATFVEASVKGHMQAGFAPKLDPLRAPGRDQLASITRTVADRVSLAMDREILRAAGASAAATPAAASPTWNGTSPTIEKDVDTYKDVVAAACGVMPNCLALTRATWLAVKQDATIKSSLGIGVKSGSAASVTRQMVQELFELEDLIIVDNIAASSAEGQAFTGAYEAIDSSGTYDGLLFHRAPITEDQFGRLTSLADNPTFMCTYEWTEANGGSSGFQTLLVPVPPGPYPHGKGTHGGFDLVVAHHRLPVVRAAIAAAKLRLLT